MQTTLELSTTVTDIGKHAHDVVPIPRKTNRIQKLFIRRVSFDIDDIGPSRIRTDSPPPRRRE